MLAQLLMVAIVMAAPDAAPQPDPTPTYRFDVEGFRAPLYGFPREDWGERLRVELDDPTLTEQSRWLTIDKRKITLQVREGESARLERLQGLLRGRGVVPVIRPDGGVVTVPQRDYALAKDVHERAAAQREAVAGMRPPLSRAATENSDTPTGEAAEPEADAAGPGQRRPLLAGVMVLGGLVLAGLVLKMTAFA